ncbi:arginine--tRNA ligase [Candidatus Daviesbacteria bacterium]|nr:arginine--tRNA ligase [Candidatus Daviesbacteria bacterium]
MLKQQLLTDLKKAIKDSGFQVTDIVCDISKNSRFGDYSTNIALQLAKQKSVDSKQSSIEIASKIIDSLGGLNYLSKAEVAGGGFINFFINPQVLVDSLDKICNLTETNFQQILTDRKKIMVEFTDPNPFKEFHIGHLFSNTIGESLSRLLEYSGAEVKRANYFGDVGMHVAKSVWGMIFKLEEQNLSLAALEQKPLDGRIQFLADAYVAGSKAFDQETETQEQIKKINLLIYIAAKAYLPKDQSQIDPAKLEQVERLFKKGKEWSLEYFEAIYEKLGTKFDYYYPESIVSEYGLEFVEKHLKEGVFERSDGAVIFPGEKYGLHRRVFINSLGLPTYEAKELGLAVKKYQDYAYDRSIVVTGNEIKEYFQVLITALSKLRSDLASKTTHIPHGMVRMTQGKISSRKGNVLTFEWLFTQVQEKIAGLMKDSDLSSEEKQKVIDIVSIGAIKFSMLKSSPHMDVTFDLEKSVSLQGDSGPYLQYTHARAKSVLKNASYSYKKTAINSNLQEEERQLLMKIDSFEDIAYDAAQNLHPSAVAAYLIDFAKLFNLFYQKYPIIKAEEKSREFRLALTWAVVSVLKLGLYLLGIKAPEKM